jgi:regulator of PEP synthase PpsR (kinase-PPPase family)
VTIHSPEVQRQISQEIESARTESTSIQEQLKHEHNVALSQKNKAHADALEEQARALQAKIETLESAQAGALVNLKREQDRTVAALQHQIATHDAFEIYFEPTNQLTFCLYKNLFKTQF